MPIATKPSTSTTDQWQPPAGCLPKDFFHGFATASYQVEGAHNEEGRAPSVWDDLTRVSGAIADGSSGDEAVNSYHMTEEDVALLAEAGCNAYRLSISWSRLIPEGGKDDPVNPQGVAYYNKLIDALLAHGIKPFITLFHWDLPSALEKRYRGWSSREIVADFERYCRVIFENFGDRVKNWITLNEPFCVVMFSSLGLKPDYSHEKDCYIISHHLILAHAKVVDAYKRDFQPTQKGTIGITLNCDWCEPFDNSPEAKAAAQRRLDFSLGLYADPIYRGHYPESMQELCPKFTEEEWKLIKGSSEFFGLNSYSTLYVSGEHDPEDVLAGQTKAIRERDGKHIGNEGQLAWLCDVPWGFGKLLAYIEERYMKPNDIPLIVTEQGFAVKNEHKKSLDDIVQDTERVDYYRGYLKEVLAARSRGMNISGYFAWSFVDNFEWLEGYIPRFGTVHVDRESKDFKRTRKESNKWLQAFFDRAIEA